MTRTNTQPTHAEQIAAQRERYKDNVLAALQGMKEFKVRTNGGERYDRVDHGFIDGIDATLQGPVDRFKLLDAIVRGLPTGALDCALSAYVIKLGGTPAPQGA